VFEFKIYLEELFSTQENEPSELAKTAKFVSCLLPPSTGKEYSMQLRQCRSSRSTAWERLRGVLIEKTRSNMVNGGSCL